jgi:pantetheine-phosphate adenylyltransferase
MRVTAVYAGSFDPVTKGHANVIRRALSMFFKVYAAVGKNTSKKCLFDENERIGFIENEFTDDELNVGLYVATFDGLLVDFCKKVGAKVIVRGLRAVTDFEYELGMAHANHSQVADIETVFLPTLPEYSFVSSSTVKELARWGGDVSQFVSPTVAAALKGKFPR